MTLKEERLARFAAADLYLVITSEFTAGRGTLATLEEAASAGIKLVQLREKSLSKNELYKLALEFRKICDRHGVLMIMNDHLDIALAVGADGVHLGQDDLPAAPAVAIAPDLIIGRSTHSREEALYEQSMGAGYVNLGPIYQTGTKVVSVPPLGLGFIRETAPLLNIPFSVMGGIKAEHIPELLDSGAGIIAMVTEITRAPDIALKVRELRSAMQKKH